MAAYSYPKRRRLLEAADYQAVFQKVRFKVSCRYFLILAVRNGRPDGRLGLVVSKKNVARAVQRNRLKRLMRELFRRRSAAVGVAGVDMSGLDIVVLARKGADTLTNQRITQKLERLLTDLAGKKRK